MTNHCFYQTERSDQGVCAHVSDGRSVWNQVNLCIFLFLYLCIGVFVYLCTCVFVYLCILVFVYSFICVFLYLCICVFVYLCSCVIGYLCMCVFVYLSICVFILVYCAYISDGGSVGNQLNNNSATCALYLASQDALDVMGVTAD